MAKKRLFNNLKKEKKKNPKPSWNQNFYNLSVTHFWVPSHQSKITILDHGAICCETLLHFRIDSDLSDTSHIVIKIPDYCHFLIDFTNDKDEAFAEIFSLWLLLF